jgi:hypothetical protein
MRAGRLDIRNSSFQRRVSEVLGLAVHGPADPRFRRKASIAPTTSGRSAGRAVVDHRIRSCASALK